MHTNRLKELRAKNKFSQDDMAEALHISQNAYSLIENGITRLVDKERINLIAEKLGVTPLELGLFDGLGITQTFNDKVENGYINHIENLYAENNDLISILKAEIENKNNQIQILLDKLT
jgi:transcriptional regulator with XRE-family HTH domain